MRILSVSNFFDTHGGGLERVAGHLSREFVQAGHAAAWAASDADGLPDNPAATVPLRCVNLTEALTGLPMPVPGPRSIMRLSRAVRDSDGIVIHDALYVTSILAMLLAKSRRKPVVLIQHIAAIPFANPVTSAMMRLANFVVTRPMMAAADRLAFVSQTVRNELLGPEPRRTSQLLFNGVDRATFNPAVRKSRDITRVERGIPLAVPLAIFVGRFVEKKGMSIIRALAEQRPDLHFALVGKGPIEPAKWGLANVHIVGQLAPDDVADLYRAGSVLILPSVGEGYPLVIQEAMACGLPVICGEGSAAADPAARQWLRGVDVDLGDAQGSAARCADAFDTLADAPVDAASMARYATENYRWDRMADAILAGFSADPD